MLRRNRHHGFTLLELVLVLVIISTVLAMAAPSLRGWSRGSALRDTVDQFMAVVRYARSQSIADCRTFRLTINSQESTYQLTTQKSEEFVEVESSFGQLFRMPQGYTLEVLEQAQTGGEPGVIEFYSTGRTQPARIRIISPDDDVVDIACTTPAEVFHVVNSGESTR